MIVDAHAHIFDVNRRGKLHTIAGDVRIGDKHTSVSCPTSLINTKFAPEALIAYLNETGVDRAVLLQGPYYGDMNEYVSEAVRQWPQRFIGAAYLDLWCDQPREHYQRAIHELGFRIIKLELSEKTGLCGMHPALRLDDPKLNWFWQDVSQREIVVVLDLGHVGGKAYQTDAVDHLMREYAALKVVIAHLAQPPAKQSENEILRKLWERQILLARFPNLWFDLSSVPNYAIARGETYPYPGALQWIRRAISLVGSEKLMWGSDAPGVLANSSYPELLSYLRDHCDFLSSNEMAGVLGLNAMNVFGIENDI